LVAFSACAEAIVRTIDATARLSQAMKPAPKSLGQTQSALQLEETGLFFPRPVVSPEIEHPAAGASAVIGEQEPGNGLCSVYDVTAAMTVPLVLAAGTPGDRHGRAIT
jgi:hypothetical protein